jgi:hypothetical protein
MLLVMAPTIAHRIGLLREDVSIIGSIQVPLMVHCSRLTHLVEDEDVAGGEQSGAVGPPAAS